MPPLDFRGHRNAARSRRANPARPACLAACTARTHGYHRANQSLSHSVTPRGSDCRMNEERSEEMSFKRALSASALAAGIGIAGAFGVGMETASADPWQGCG